MHRWSLTSFHWYCTPELGSGCIQPEQPLGALAMGEQSPRGELWSPGVWDPSPCCDDLSSPALEGKSRCLVFRRGRCGPKRLSLTISALNKSFQQLVPAHSRVWGAGFRGVK